MLPLKKQCSTTLAAVLAAINKDKKSAPNPHHSHKLLQISLPVIDDISITLGVQNEGTD